MTCWDLSSAFVSALVVPVPSGNFSAPHSRWGLLLPRTLYEAPVFPPVPCPPWPSDFAPGPCSVAAGTVGSLSPAPAALFFYPQMFALFRNLSPAFSL